MYLFNRHNKDGSGTLEVDEFKAALTEVGVMLEAQEMEDLVQEIDTDGDGMISILKFAERLRQAKRDHLHVAGVFLKPGGVHKHFEDSTPKKLRSIAAKSTFSSPRYRQPPNGTPQTGSGPGAITNANAPESASTATIDLSLDWLVALRAKQDKAALTVQSWYRNWKRNRPATGVQHELDLPAVRFQL
jgi:hypothetical protein